MMWRSIPAIISKQAFLAWQYRPGLWLLVCCLWGLLAPVAGAETLHFWGESLELEAQTGRLEGNQARLFWGDYQLLANEIVWDAQSQRYLARGEVTFRSAIAEVKAETLQLLLAQGHLLAQNAELRYLDQFQAQASSLWLSEDVWRLEQVQLRLRDSPLQLQASTLRLLPQSAMQLLQLEDLQLVGPEGWPGPTIPYLEWPLKSEPAVAEIRNPVQQFQPQLGWQNGQLQLGLNAKIWQNEQQRLYLQTGSSPQGFQGVLSHEWRPQPETVINTQLGLLNQSLQGHLEVLSPTLLPLWLAGALRWQEWDRFAQQFWLPEQVSSFRPVSSAELLASSDYSYWGDLQYRYVLGARWSPTSAQAGASLLGNLPLFQGAGQDLWGSVLVNGFYEQGPQGTLGLRLLDRWQFSSEWQAGLYLEQYLSTWSAERFLQSTRLTPWLGGFVRWLPHPDLALVFETALSVSSGQLVLADALLSWRVKPIYLNLMLRGIPTGLQLQLQVEELGF